MKQGANNPVKNIKKKGKQILSDEEGEAENVEEPQRLRQCRG